ncbi:phage tail sheath subtilisin-like domain-containing protein [Roseobacter sp. YSTF-M11]|uniref:Phage tail sheath subtilisin-like domain-containing protein n=1 Tax=Roseobacter insulae TaxID=2859783 RepID=A0A9X1FZF8_9RHOB|nr:phage tail sheath subtilisin-like domain-containing protein [Roseobacter insulae]MBW4710433.1 phage tail sheath subtilisin-like domain-containing protein [Roseobacter insulae]
MEQILPGVSVAVRPEGLIIPGVVSISAIGMVGTASKGPVNEPVIIGSTAEAREVFGEADAFDPDNPGDELTLIRAIDLAYDHGARDVIAVRASVPEGQPGVAEHASFTVQSAGGDCCTLLAKTPGNWGNDLGINISPAEENAVIADETHNGPVPISLTHTQIVESARNRIAVLASGSTVAVDRTVVVGAAPAAGEVQVDLATGDLTFPAGEEPGGADTVIATYVVRSDDAVKVTLRHDLNEETFTAVNGQHLADLLEDSDFAELDGTAGNPNIGEIPTAFATTTEFQLFGGGSNGAAGASYNNGFEALANEPAFIIVAAGQDNGGTIGADLTAHVTSASSDTNKRERIGVIGSPFEADLDDILGHTLNSDRIVFVAPGVTVSDVVTGEPVTLSGGYAAAAVAGMISGAPINRSLTNKVLSVAGLEEEYTQAELRRLVQARVLALEKKLGFRTVKGITTSTNTAWHQITTRRIVDFAVFGVRSAANPYIGLLNNERVRAAMQSTINSFLAEMVIDEQLVSYELEVTATRDDEIRGIARVTIVLRPTFSIDFIKVTMFLE